MSGEPAAIGGFVPVWPGLGSGWIWGTDHWDDVVMEVTRALRRDILPSLDRRGLRRMEVRPMAANVAAIRWLGLVGFRLEAVTPRFGRGDEDFVLDLKELLAHAARSGEVEVGLSHGGRPQ